MEDIIITSDCINTKTSPNEKRKFGFSKKSIFKLKNALTYDEIPFPEDSLITCNFEYEVDEKVNNATTVLINAP